MTGAGRRIFFFLLFYSLLFPMIFERLDYISTAGAGREETKKISFNFFLVC